MANSSSAQIHTPPPLAAFVHHARGRTVIVEVMGEVDLSNAKDLDAALAQFVRPDGNVVVDLSACTYIDSSGLGVVACANKATGNRLVIVASSKSPVRRILEICGLDHLLGVATTVDEALNQLPR